jgi:hypothetical protein
VSGTRPVASALMFSAVVLVIHFKAPLGCSRVAIVSTTASRQGLMLPLPSSKQRRRTFRSSQRAQRCKVRNQSTEPQVRQRKGSSIPPQEAQMGSPPGPLAGNRPVCLHCGQTPRRRTLRVAQVAQKTPWG